ncbi:DUF6701 domain-containing protein [Pseudoalteromonas pernae]|uniref:DUF6701 domain-containing protein n=1 Tax=Pseudoalteromonas pernae TaxID=3118054 RepID=UPI00324246A2
MASPISAMTRCEDLFTGPVNENLAASGGGIAQEDLDAFPWQNNPWPASGSILSGGDYFFTGLNVTSGRGYDLIILPGEQVTIYVNGSLLVNNRLDLNVAGDASQLTIVARYDIEINNLSVINGLLFAGRTLSINANNAVVGGLASNGPINVGSNTEITFDPDAAANLELPGLCNSGDAQVHHYRLTHSTSTVRCLSSSITIQACADENCSALYTDPNTVQLSSTAGSYLNSGTITLNNGVGTGFLQHPQGGNATIGIANASTPVSNSSECYASGLASDCTINFVDAGLAFFGPDGVSALSSMRAGLAQNITLRAVETDEQTGACQARVQGSQLVSFGLSCENPGSCQSTEQGTINGTIIGKNSQGLSSNKANVSVAFDTNGAAALAFNYTDVGAIQLHAFMNVAATLEEPAFALSGSSDVVVSQPYAMIVGDVTDANGNANPQTTNSGDGFIVAEEPFTVQVRSVNYSGALTPNFGLETPAQKAVVAFDSAVYPTPNLGSAALLSSGTFAPSATLGVQQSDTVVWREAGTIKLSASIENDSYLGQTFTGDTPVSDNIGRFYPNDFKLVSSAVLDSCSAFSYMDDPKLSVAWTANAVGAQGRVLKNYGANYQGTAEFAYVARNLASDNLTASLGSRFTAELGSWVEGVYVVDTNTAKFSRLVDAQLDTQLDGPYSELQVGVSISTEIDSRMWQSADMDAASTTSCTTCTAKALAGMLDVRFGRMRLENSFGSEFEPLQVPMQTQYWQGTGWALNTADACTSYAATQLSDSSAQLQLTGSGTLALGGYDVGEGMFADSQGKTGDYPLSYPASDWLLWDWDGDGKADNDPTAVLRFGSYRGNDRIIYWRETGND